MTRMRYYGNDSDFGGWLRDQTELPSNSIDFGLVASDVDFVVQNWKRKATGQHFLAMMFVEIKTRGGEVKFPQSLMLENLSRFSGDVETPKKVVRFFGWFSLQMSGTRPDNSEWMVWRRFKWKKSGCDTSKVLCDKISLEQLISLLRFDIHPSSLRPWNPEISHHGSKTIIETLTTELGMKVDFPIRKVW